MFTGYPTGNAFVQGGFFPASQNIRLLPEGTVLHAPFREFANPHRYPHHPRGGHAHRYQPAGDVFGGWIVSQMDLAAGTTAAFRANGRCATIAINSLVFMEPVMVGDEVSIYTRIIRAGRTSLTIHVETWRRARHTHLTSKVTEGEFIFVALDENRRPRQLPPAQPGDELPEIVPPTAR